MLLKFATATILVMGLILGSAGATAYAAQDSLPSETLYPLKIALEDISLELAGGEAAKSQLALKYALRRGDEIIALMAQGDHPDEALMWQFQVQTTNALQQVAGMPDHEMQAALVQYRASLMQQQQKMSQAGQQGVDDPALETVESLIQIHRQAAEQGIQDPATFRQQLQSGNLYGQPEMPGPYGPPEEALPGDEQTGPGPGGKPDEPGPAQLGPAEKPPGGAPDGTGNSGVVTPQAPGGPKGPGGSGGPSSGPSQGSPGSGGKGNGGKGGGPAPTPTPVE